MARAETATRDRAVGVESLSLALLLPHSGGAVPVAGAAPFVFPGYGSRMLHDFLVESRCACGHTSAAAFRGYRREQVQRVVELLSDRCGWRVTADGDDECGARTAHTLEELGASDVDEEAVRAFRLADTLPAMSAVVDPRELPGPRSSMPPPPMPDDDGPITAGG